MSLSAKLKISVFIATSLDGYIARADGDVVWLDEIDPLGDEDDAGYGEIFNAVDALVMGRGSFEKVLEFDPWPYGAKPLIVLSKTLTVVPSHLADVVSIDPTEPRAFVEKLVEQGYKHIYLDGGKVIQSFLRKSLVDEMTITTIPILIGEGIPLFGKLEKDVKLKLLRLRSWKNGMTQATYQVLK